MFRIFSIYIIKQAAFNFFAILLGISFVILLFDLLELVRILFSRNVSLLQILQMGMLKNLTNIQKVLPFIVLLSAMITYSRLTKSYELIAARAMGFSIWDFLKPAAMFFLILGSLNIIILNPITVYFLSKYEKLESTILKGHASLLSLSSTGLWITQSTEENKKNILHALRVNQEEQELFDITFYFFDENNGFDYRLDAEKAVLTKGAWKVTNANVTMSKHRYSHHDEYNIPTNLSFQKIQESVISPETISFWKLPNFIRIAEESGLSAVRHKLYFYKALFSPIFMVALMLLGTAFAFTLPRSNKAGKLMFIGTVAGFIVYFMSDVIFALGASGRISPALAAAIPSLFCLSIGLYLNIYREEN